MFGKRQLSQKRTAIKDIVQVNLSKVYNTDTFRYCDVRDTMRKKLKYCIDISQLCFSCKTY